MKLHQVFFGLLIFFLPTQLGKHFWPDFSFLWGIRVDYLAPTLYLTDLLVGGIFVSWLWEKRNNFPIKKNWFLIVIFLYLFFTSLLAQNPGAAFYKFIKILEFLFLGFYVAKTQLPNRLIAKLLSLGLIFESLLAWFQFLRGSSIGGIFWWLGERTFNLTTPGIALGDLQGEIFLRPYGTFSHPNSLAGFFLVVLILVLGTKLSFWWKGPTLILGTPILILSFSQAVWLTGLLIILMMMVEVWSKRNEEKRTLSRISFLLLVIFTGVGFSLFFPYFGDQPTKERAFLVMKAIEMIKVSPLTGVGLNNFLVHLRFLQPVHNIFLLVIAETGLVGFIIFGWFLFLTFKRVILKERPVLFFSLLAIFFTGFFDHYWLTLQQNLLLSSLILGFAWSKTTLDAVK